MNPVTIFLIILYAIIGGLPTLYLIFSIPAVLAWKIYRKIHSNISMMY